MKNLRYEIACLVLAACVGPSKYFATKVNHHNTLANYEAVCKDEAGHSVHLERIRFDDPKTGSSEGVCEITHFMSESNYLVADLVGDCRGLQSRVNELNPKRSDKIDECLGN